MPILLQASNDEIDKVDVASRRDAFCGKFSVANNFYEYGVPFTDQPATASDVDGEGNSPPISTASSASAGSCAA